MATKDGRVVIVGASMAGLLAARVLADIASEVFIIERDNWSDQPEARKGVPQGRHAHALLRAGQLIVEELFPGLIEDLVARGAQRLFWLASGLWWQFDGYRARHGEDFELIMFTRPFLEDAIRHRVAAVPNVRIRSGVGVDGLLAPDGQVKGVVIGKEGKGGESTLDADLVVDASGRGSQAGAWLKALGHMPPPVDQVRIDMGYASRLVRREPGQLPDRTYVATIGTPPQCKRSAYLLPVEGDRWLVTLCGFFGDHAPTDDAGFLSFAESLPTNDIASVLRQAKPLTPIVTHRLPSDQWRRFEKLKNPPAGFVAIGDGVCSFNPIYGQGMSSAAQQAIALRQAVQGKHGFASPALPRNFYKAAARIIANPWQIAAGGDFCYPEATGRRPPLTDLLNAYLRKAIMAAHQDPVVGFAIANVQNLLAPPPSLLRPQIALRVWKGWRRSPSLSAGLHTH
jgi:2-polyprenyl-6-methoxyphenol hydroxylase-like FAD-dependent oxidoreductase